MKKFIALFLAFVMVFAVSVNVFAFEQVLDENGSPKYTKPVDYKTADAEIKISDENVAWEFKSPSGYYYTVIPVDTVTVDGEKQYLFISNNYYGKFPGGTAELTKDAEKADRDKFVFDPEIATSYAYWLNNGFFDGSAPASEVNGSGGAALDSEIASYIRTHNWYVNGYNGKDADNTYIDKKYNFDYTVNCKVATLSTEDIAKYAGYMKMTLKSAGAETVVKTDSYACILRTFGALDGTGATSFIKRQNPASGNTGNSKSSLCGIRPIFYVSENYFKNVKLDLSSAGSEVKKIISELNPSIYTPDEMLALKGVFTISADGSEGTLSPADWTNAANATIDENGVYNITNGKWIGRNLPEKVQGGVITVEADVNEAIGNGLHIGLLYDGDASPSFKYPFYIMGSSDVGQGGYYKEASQGKGASYKRLENKDYDLWCNHFNKPFRVKVTVNLDTGNSYVSISGKSASDNSDLVKYSDGTTVLPYINGEKVFSKVAFYNSSANVTKIDNIKITYDANGNAYDTVKALDENTLVVTFKDYVNTANVTAADVFVSSNSTVSVTPNGNKLTVKFEKKVSSNGGYMVVNNLKRADAKSASYCIIGNGTAFGYEMVEYTADVAINNPAFTSGSTVTATAGITSANTSGKALELILAAYKGNRIVGISDVVRFNVTGGSADEQTETATLTLGEDADTIKAFLWDDNMLPAAFDSVTAE